MGLVRDDVSSVFSPTCGDVFDRLIGSISTFLIEKMECIVVFYVRVPIAILFWSLYVNTPF